jgi:cyclopropane fatty-acyl-phospholipid synthase-like methyltransferase
MPMKEYTQLDSMAQSEIDHSRMLAARNTEKAWGWDTPAGRLRAQRRSDMIARGARLSTGMRALEIGCGTGMFTELFAETGAQLVAVDISIELLQKAFARNLPPNQVKFLE